MNRRSVRWMVGLVGVDAGMENSKGVRDIWEYLMR
jgi:hypothetical protein